MWFAFPLYPGKSWINKYDWEYLGAAPAKGKAEDHGTVLGWEDVAVPAGTYHALKVVVKQPLFRSGRIQRRDCLDLLVRAAGQPLREIRL